MRKIIPRLSRLKREKVKAGHYIYAGYHIKHEWWYPKGRGGKAYLTWKIKDLDHVKWTKRRFFRLDKTIKHLDYIRKYLYEHCFGIEDESSNRTKS